MKKTIVIGAVSFVLSICSAAAQDAPVTATVSQRFEDSFKGATDLKWRPLENLYEVTFMHAGDFCIAFLDQEGRAVTNGRRIRNIHDLPILVRNGLYNAKARTERKYGALTVGSIFEMLKDQSTQYYVPMENSAVSVIYAIAANGYFVEKSRTRRHLEPKLSKPALARRN